MTMTKKQAIEYYIEHIQDIDLIHLIAEINSYNGAYEEHAFYNMDEFNDIYAGVSPLQIAEDVTDACGNFNIIDDYFYYDCAGVLCSCDEPTAADLIRTNCTEDLVDDFMNMRNCEPVADCDGDLWDIITADDDAIFDDEGHEIPKMTTLFLMIIMNKFINKY